MPAPSLPLTVGWAGPWGGWGLSSRSIPARTVGVQSVLFLRSKRLATQMAAAGAQRRYRVSGGPLRACV